MDRNEWYRTALLKAANDNDSGIVSGFMISWMAVICDTKRKLRRLRPSATKQTPRPPETFINSETIIKQHGAMIECSAQAKSLSLRLTLELSYECKAMDKFEQVLTKDCKIAWVRAPWRHGRHAAERLHDAQGQGQAVKRKDMSNTLELVLRV